MTSQLAEHSSFPAFTPTPSHSVSSSSTIPTTTYSYSPNAMPSWDELRKEARILESEIDARLDSYSKYAQSLLREDLNNPANATAAAVAASVVDPSISASSLDNHGVEIKRLLQRLAKVKEDMSRHVSRQESKDQVMLLPILHQYEGKYNGYSRDFKKSKQHVTEAMQQLLLGRNLGKEREQLSRKDALLRERASLHSTEKGLDAVIAQAQEAKQRLANQNFGLRQTLTRITTLGGNFPVLNDLMTKIGRAKQRDYLVLGAVISVCILFLIWWGFG